MYPAGVIRFEMEFISGTGSVLLQVLRIRVTSRQDGRQPTFSVRKRESLDSFQLWDRYEQHCPVGISKISFLHNGFLLNATAHQYFDQYLLPVNPNVLSRTKLCGGERDRLRLFSIYLCRSTSRGLYIHGSEVYTDVAVGVWASEG